MPKNNQLHLRISTKTKELLSEVSKATELKETDLARLGLNSFLIQLKTAAIKSGGYDKLQLFRHIEIN